MNLDWVDKFKNNVKEKEKAGIEYAHAKSNSWYQQKLEKQIVSKIILGLPNQLSVAERERVAYSSDDYAKYLLETKEAIAKEILANVQYEKQENIFEGLRSLCSFEKKTQYHIGE